MKVITFQSLKIKTHNIHILSFVLYELKTQLKVSENKSKREKKRTQLGK
jgi:hypothetical protein